MTGERESDFEKIKQNKISFLTFNYDRSLEFFFWRALKNLYSNMTHKETYDLFKSININENCEQPHEYKLRLANELNLDYYIEDNLDIVVYLKDRVKAKVFWIYNLMDRRHPYPDKFPCLEEALKEVEI